MTTKPKTKFSDLTDREKRLVLAHVKGLSGLEATRDAGLFYKNQNSATAAIRRVLSYPAAKNYAARIKADALAMDEKNACLSILEKRMFLARNLRAKINDTPDDSDLWQEFRETTTEHSSTLLRKLPDKHRAIALDNELAGHKAPDKVEHSTDDILGAILSDIAANAHKARPDKL